MPAPSVVVHTMLVTASVISPSPADTGSGSVVRTSSAVQPAIGTVPTLVNGVAVGRASVTLVVLAVSDSLGTLSVSRAYDPASAVFSSSVTWAPAASGVA